MPRLVVVLAMCLVQLQPLAAAAACQHHHAMAASHHCTGPADHRAMTGETQHDHSMADECLASQACTSTAAAVVAVTMPLAQASPSIAAAMQAPVENPESALPASPFHPPKA